MTCLQLNIYHTQKSARNPSCMAFSRALLKKANMIICRMWLHGSRECRVRTLLWPHTHTHKSVTADVVDVLKAQITAAHAVNSLSLWFSVRFFSCMARCADPFVSAWVLNSCIQSTFYTKPTRMMYCIWSIRFKLLNMKFHSTTTFLPDGKINCSAFIGLLNLVYANHGDSKIQISSEHK